ncbi:MAG: PAS domain S-box protein, partial [Deltaproteobacteria bacterium]|nr:PAS domain S-box protein [Deltaproteobacteria bacterium]
MTENRKNKLRELRATLGKIEVALGAISDAIVWTDQSGRIQWCNKAFDELVGSPHIVNLGKPLGELLPVWEHGTLLPYLGHPVSLILQRKENIDGYYDYIRNEQTTYLEFLGRYLEMPGAQESAVIVIRDISQEKNLEQIKLQSAALHHAANAIAITDKEGAVMWVNRSFTALTGYTLEDVYGRTLGILKSGKHEESFYRNLWSTILSKKVWEGETTNRRKDGSL